MTEQLPAVNATLNGLATILLILGAIFIKRKQIAAHRACMVAALVVSACFLASYLFYHANAGSKKFPGVGVWRFIYFYVILIPHILLAVGMLPMIYFTFARALRGDLEKHRALARWTLPIWLYVSVTGVVVYVMLYHISWTAGG